MHVPLSLSRGGGLSSPPRSRVLGGSSSSWQSDKGLNPSRAPSTAADGSLRDAARADVQGWMVPLKCLVPRVTAVYLRGFRG